MTNKEILEKIKSSGYPGTRSEWEWLLKIAEESINSLCECGQTDCPTLEKK